jgi:BirA family biotin operon repressor/biotin-[acetyl-CoA-carboxylase] ligase
MNVENLKEVLSTKYFGREILYFDEIDSTNTFAKQLAENGKPEGTLVIAEFQTNGRGRMDRKWVSAKGKNLMVTIILRPSFSYEYISVLPMLFALSMCETLRSYNIHATTKWPNDILLNGKKICGMLLESSFAGNNVNFILAGIGLNIHQEYFPDELKDTASSLFLETQQQFDRWKFLTSFLLQSEEHYVNFSHITAGKIIEQWKSFSSMFGKEILLAQNGNTLLGKAIDISSRGELIVEIDSQLTYFSSADVTILRH